MAGEREIPAEVNERHGRQDASNEFAIDGTLIADRVFPRAISSAQF